MFSNIVDVESKTPHLSCYEMKIADQSSLRHTFYPVHTTVEPRHLFTSVLVGTFLRQFGVQLPFLLLL
jgi:hypothetical protein